MKGVFADTFYWIALTNPRDSAHEKVLEFSRPHYPQLILTTDEVLTELLAFCASDHQLRIQTALVVNDVLAGTNVRVIPQTGKAS